MEHAVLLMAYGGPSALADVEDYLRDVMGGRKPTPAMVEEVSARYARIGGRSPLLDITQAQAGALEHHLNAVAMADRYRVYVGMRHWQPYIRQAVAAIARDGLRHVVALCMTPQYSRLSVGAYFQHLQQAQADLGAELDVTLIESWHTHPLLIQAMAENLDIARQGFAIEEREWVKVIFCGHSLPASIINEGDPYDAQLRETASLVAERLNLAADAWQFCYQGAGRRPGAWLGPELEDVIVRLANAGHRHILVAPVGFVADHVETLYDIDIECRALAAQHGAHLERMPSLNTSPTFIAALANIVQQADSHE